MQLYRSTIYLIMKYVILKLVGDLNVTKHSYSFASEKTLENWLKIQHVMSILNVN